MADDNDERLTVLKSGEIPRQAEMREDLVLTPVRGLRGPWRPKYLITQHWRGRLHPTTRLWSEEEAQMEANRIKADPEVTQLGITLEDPEGTFVRIPLRDLGPAPKEAGSSTPSGTTSHSVTSATAAG